jgi:hypothetical protein
VSYSSNQVFYSNDNEQITGTPNMYTSHKHNPEWKNTDTNTNGAVTFVYIYMKFKNKQGNLLWLEVRVAVGKGGSTIGGEQEKLLECWSCSVSYFLISMRQISLRKFHKWAHSTLNKFNTSVISPCSVSLSCMICVICDLFCM